MQAKVALLIGSGVSKPSDAPMVDEVTSRIAEGAWRFMSDQRFVPGPWPSEFALNDIAERAQTLIRMLHSRIEGHLRARDGRSPNYEDYFACLEEIVDDEDGEFVNPLIRPFADALEVESAHLWQEIHSHKSRLVAEDRAEPMPFASLADLAVGLIQWGVYYSLAPSRSPKGLGFVSQCIQRFGVLDIFTLNHDLLMESYLENENIDYADGFGESEGDCKLFNCSWDNFSGPACLFKLHGSIDWYLVPIKHRGIIFLAKMHGDVDHSKDSKGERIWPRETTPRFLTGSHQKEREYGRVGFAEIFERFRSRLSGVNNIICCGYGWRDKGINIRIDQWLHDSAKNRLILLHDVQEQKRLIEARFWWTRWNPYQERGQLIVHPKWMCNSSIEEIEPLLA